MPRTILVGDSWEVDDENDYVLFRFYKRDGPFGNGYTIKIDGLGAMGMGRALLKHGAAAEITRQVIIETREEEKRLRKKRRGLFAKDR